MVPQEIPHPNCGFCVRVCVRDLSGCQEDLFFCHPRETVKHVAFLLARKQTFPERFGQQENSKCGRDWCNKQSPDGAAHTEALCWNSLGFVRLKHLRDSAWSSLQLTPKVVSHPVIWCMNFMRACIQKDAMTLALKVSAQLQSGH